MRSSLGVQGFMNIGHVSRTVADANCRARGTESIKQMEFEIWRTLCKISQLKRSFGTPFVVCKTRGIHKLLIK